MKVAGRLVVLLAAALVSGCEPSPKSSRGFRLPDGDAKKGEQVFLDLKCNRCHKVEGVELPAPEKFNLVLGGETAQVKTYGELVTSIINPSHVLSERYQRELAQAKESPMPQVTSEMTVGQMIDLVAFLQSRYRLSDRAFEAPLP